MNVLAVDTSTKLLHISLQAGTKSDSRMIIKEGQHSEDLMGVITTLLSSLSLTYSDLDLLVTTQGPGSFTSLRIGYSTLKGISLAKEIPLVSIPTLDVIANSFTLDNILTIAVIDAKKRRYYLAGYKNGEKVISELDGNAVDIIPLIKDEKTIILTGPDAHLFYNELKPLTSDDTNIILDKIQNRALGKILLELGVKRFLEQGEDDIGTGPIYVRRSDAEEALLSKLKEEKSNV